MSLWYDNGGLIYKSGGLMECEVCPCETGTGTVAPGCDCDYCTGITPLQLSLYLPALTDASCSDCASFEGTYVLTQFGNCCWWRYDGANPTSCGPLGYDYIVINAYKTLIYIEVTVSVSNGPLNQIVSTWRYTTGAIDCNNFNSLAIPHVFSGICTGSADCEITTL